ncbi:MAG: DUF2806 domain-containing protein [Desulfovibrionaceae bacterium]|nr:DUF2806 domain-containing protein [Desulfovibrionaceae bacterium]
MSDITDDAIAVAEAGKKCVGVLDSILTALDKHGLLPLWEFRKRNMRTKQEIELELKEKKHEHELKLQIEQKKAKLKLDALETAGLCGMKAIEAAKKAIEDGVPAQHALADNDPSVFLAIHNLFVEAMENQHAKEMISLYGLRETLDNPDEKAPEKQVDETWFSYFWDYAKHMRDENVQQLWGRLLAGEIKQPGTFSLKTLSVLQTLGPQDVANFEKLAPYAIDSCFLLEETFDHLGVNFYRIATLGSLGVLVHGTARSYNGPIAALNHNFMILGVRTPTSLVKLRGAMLTPVGSELCRLVKVDANKNEECARFLAESLRKKFPDMEISLRPVQKGGCA